jgi:hypothetical protein
VYRTEFIFILFYFFREASHELGDFPMVERWRWTDKRENGRKEEK